MDLNYDTSWLNPALKLLNVGLYFLVAFVYYRARDAFSGDLRKALAILFWMGVILTFTSIARYFGHGLEFGFSTEFSLKWFESLGNVIGVVLLAFAARALSKGIVPDVRG